MPLSFDEAVHHEADHCAYSKEGTNKPENLGVLGDLLQPFLIIRAVPKLISESAEKKGDDQEVASSNFICSPSFKITFEFLLRILFLREAFQVPNHF